jgi:methylthioribulose-1-phosphate dehydratase
MAPSGVDKGRVRGEDLLEVDRTGRVLRGKGRASAETPLHVMLAETAGAGSVLHTHSLAATLLSEHARSVGAVSLADLEMLKGLEGVPGHATVVRIPVVANDQDLRRLSDVAQAHREVGCPGLLVAGHGLYAWGNSLDQARRHLETLEFLLELQWRRLLLQAIAANREPLP